MVYGGIIRLAACPKRFVVSSLRHNKIIVLGCPAYQRLPVTSDVCAMEIRKIRVILYVKWVWFMGVAYKIRRGYGVGLPVPETSFEKLGPM